MASRSGVAEVYGQALLVLDSVGQGYLASLRAATAVGDDGSGRRDLPIRLPRRQTVDVKQILRRNCRRELFLQPLEPANAENRSTVL